MKRKNDWLLDFGWVLLQHLEHEIAFEMGEAKDLVLETVKGADTTLINIFFDDINALRQCWIEDVCDELRDFVSVGYPINRRAVQVSVQADSMKNVPVYRSEKDKQVYWIEVSLQNKWLNEVIWK